MWRQGARYSKSGGAVAGRSNRGVIGIIQIVLAKQPAGYRRGCSKLCLLHVGIYMGRVEARGPFCQWVHLRAQGRWHQNGRLVQYKMRTTAKTGTSAVWFVQYKMCITAKIGTKTVPARFGQCKMCVAAGMVPRRRWLDIRNWAE